MASATAKFFREEGDRYVFDGSYCEVYLPDWYFDKGVAQQVGSAVETIGIFPLRVFSSKEAKSGTLGELRLPVPIRMTFSSSYKATLSLGEGYEPSTQYTVLQLSKGDSLIDQLNVKQDSRSTVSFIRLLHGGKLPTSIPYDEIMALYYKNLDLTGADLGVPSLALEIVVAEICRSRGELAVPFRKEAGRGRAGLHDYRPVNMKLLPAINSTFGALSFEDVNQAVVSSIRKSREGKPENISPVEKTIKY